MIVGAFLIFQQTDRAQAQITTRSDNIGKLLNQWQTEGTAAGLGALMYENRDGGHSMLDVKVYPQLQLLNPTVEEKASKHDIGPASLVRQFPVFGNCSMAAPADKGGSLPRMYLLAQSGFDFLNNQYLHNNLYFYPEHQDYDSGYNGQPGWGDLYPANSPYMVISQGSSFTDQPFLQAFLATTAAFTPETQALLIKSHALAPTLQSIFRKSNRMVKSDEDYLNGKAHPPVFDGAQIDEEKMVLLAHGMTRATLPPVVILNILKEDSMTADKHFFEASNIKDEKLGTSLGAIARVFRGTTQQRHYTLSAKKSADFMQRPLTIKWVLLQGDPNLVKIEPSNDGMESNITVSWHPEIRADTGITSHRVDIGVFANNGTGWSAPGLFSIYMLPNEARFYDAEGRLEEIYYEAGTPDLGLPANTDLRWLTLGRRLSSQAPSLAIQLFKQKLTEDSMERLIALADDLAHDQDTWRTLSRAPDKKPLADEVLLKIQGQLQSRLTMPLKGSPKTLAQSVADAFSALADNTDLYLVHHDALMELAANSAKISASADLARGRKRLLDLKIYTENADHKSALTHDAAMLTAGERYQLRQFHFTLLSQVLFPEFLERSTNPAFVDVRLTTPKVWRDLYRYDNAGKCSGWSRYTNGRTYEFDIEGHLLPDGQGGRSVEVSYVVDAASGRLIFLPK